MPLTPFFLATLTLNLAAGAAYLLYLGISLWRSAGRGERACRRGPAGLQTLVLGLMFNVSGTLVNAAVAWLAGSARTLLESRARRAWFQRASAAILTALGLRLALAR
jgi:threonine/homoserine/homoserine lactone efflux protein